MCKVEDHQRLRLCRLVLNSEYFDGRVILPSDISLIQKTGCSCVKVSFKTVEVEEDAGHKEYREWMIGCYTLKDSNDVLPSKRMFRLSRAYNNSNNVLTSNDIFVYPYHLESRKFYLAVNAFTNVRV